MQGNNQRDADTQQNKPPLLPQTSRQLYHTHTVTQCTALQMIEQAGDCWLQTAHFRATNTCVAPVAAAATTRLMFGPVQCHSLTQALTDDWPDLHNAAAIKQTSASRLHERTVDTTQQRSGDPVTGPAPDLLPGPTCR